MLPAEPELSIERVPPDAARRAIAFLFLPAAPTAQGDPHAHEWLFWALQSDQIRAVVSAGHTGGQIVDCHGSLAALVGRNGLSLPLWQYVRRELTRSTPAIVAQLLTSPHLTELEAASGWRLLTQVEFRWAAPHPDPLGEPNPLRLVPATDHEQLLQVFRETLVDSRDCPELDRWRSSAETLRDFGKGQASPAPSGRLLMTDSEIVGCVVMDYRTDGVAPLTLHYFGILPRCRGRRLGELALRLLRGGGERHGGGVLAVVDQRNVPAVRGYQAAGYRLIRRRKLWLLPLRSLGN